MLVTTMPVVQVTEFMSQRFIPILDRLPESCDWNLHVVTVTPPVISGDTNRSTHSDREAKYVAAAIVKEARQIGATGEKDAPLACLVATCCLNLASSGPWKADKLSVTCIPCALV